MLCKQFHAIVTPDELYRVELKKSLFTSALNHTVHLISITNLTIIIRTLVILRTPSRTMMRGSGSQVVTNDRRSSGKKKSGRILKTTSFPVPGSFFLFS
ncbi:hypothetical protein DMENIID0001_161980 [Sergentomyia squamirostris]